MRYSVHKSILVFSSVALAACTAPRPFEAKHPADTRPTDVSNEVAQPQTQAATPNTSTTPEPLPAPVPQPRTLTPATKALVAQAQSQSNAGNDALAAATIERALRIEPGNPLLWIELAKIRHNQGNEPQAENLARKALSMSVGDGKTQAAAWRVIADSYRARGRNPEARDAEAKASGLEG